MPSPWAQWRATTRQHPRLVKTGRATVVLTQWVCAWHLFAEYIGGPRVVSGPSMLPTMNLSGDLVLEDCLSHHLSPPRISRGDLLTLLSPREPGKTICKRVIGLPGDTVCVDPTKAVRTSMGEKRPGQESEGGGPWGPEHVVVPEGHIWIGGDNTAASRDSRVYGPVPIALVRGRIFARIYPAPRWFSSPIVYID